MPHLLSLRLLLPLAATGVIGGSVILSTIDRVPQGAITLEPASHVAVPGESFSVNVVVASQVPANVFSGSLSFDPAVITVDSISYNTSIADLWAEKPWYANGDGTINFTGGTTKKGGFTGKDTLLTITFTAKTIGDSRLAAEGLYILAYDGLGSELAIRQSLDAVYEIIPTDEAAVASTQQQQQQYNIVTTKLEADLNGDGKYSFIDVSIFMTMLATQNQRADFNQDDKVNTADLKLLQNEL